MDLKEVVDSILASRKYRALYRPTVVRIVEDCSKRFGPVRALDEAKNVLHRIWGSYYATRPDFKKLIGKFEKELTLGGRDKAIEMVLRLHASSSERLPFFDDFYRSIFEKIGPITSVADYGCCLDPIAFERFGLGAGVRYSATDIDSEEIDFLQKACALLGYGTQVQLSCGDAITDEAVSANVVFMLKLLPVLEQQRQGAAKEVLLKQTAPWLVVSYPVASLSGKEKGMREFYAGQFYELIAGTDWEVEELLFPTELVFIVKRLNGG